MMFKRFNAIIAVILSSVCLVVAPRIIKTFDAEATPAIKLYNEGLNILNADNKFDGWNQSDNVSWVYTSTVKENVPKDDKCAYISKKNSGVKELITMLNKNDDKSRFPLTVGVTYTASINYYATGSATLSIVVNKSMNVTLRIQSYKITAGGWNNISMTFTPENENENFAKIRFEITDLDGDIYLDDAYFGIVGDTESNLKTDYGAYLRLEKDSCGIRFRGRIDKNYLDGIYADEGKTDVSYGIILTKTVYDNTTLKKIDSGYFTVEQLTGYGIPFMLMEAKKIYNSATSDKDGFYGFNCVLIKVKDENLKVDFSARTYLKYTENGKAVYEYSDYDEDANSRSVGTMVERAWGEKDIFTEEERALLQEYKERLSSLSQAI